MTPFATARRAFVMVVALLACAVTAHAGAGGGASLDEPAHGAPRSSRPATATATPKGTCDDDSPCLRAGAAAKALTPTRNASHAASGATLPAKPDPRSDKHERARAATSGVAQVHRPGVQRVKGHVRSMPATPGMGLLLRYGTGVGREISMNVDDLEQAPSTLRSGRGPPRAAPTSAIAPATRPRPTYLAGTPRASRPIPHPGEPTTRDPHHLHRTAPIRGIGSIAPAGPANRLGALAALAVVTPSLPHSRATPWKGAPACSTPPFGGTTP